MLNSIFDKCDGISMHKVFAGIFWYFLLLQHAHRFCWRERFARLFKKYKIKKYSEKQRWTVNIFQQWRAQWHVKTGGIEVHLSIKNMSTGDLDFCTRYFINDNVPSLVSTKYIAYLSNAEYVGETACEKQVGNALREHGDARLNVLHIQLFTKIWEIWKLPLYPATQ